jgi:hypothetical protein
VIYLTGALYVHPLWFYKYQHDNRVRSKLFLACQRWLFQWRFWFLPSVPGYMREEEEHKPDRWRNPIQRNDMGLHLENEVAKLLKPRQSFWITLYFAIIKLLKLCTRHEFCCDKQRLWYVKFIISFRNISNTCKVGKVGVVADAEAFYAKSCRGGRDDKRSLFASLFWKPLVSVCPSVTHLQPLTHVSDFQEILWKVFHEMFSSKGDFRENRPNDNCTLIKGLKEFILVLSIFRDQFGWNSI